MGNSHGWRQRLGRGRVVAGMALALAGAVGGAGAAAAEPISAEHFFQAPTVGKFALSPSGKRLALTTRAPNGRIGLFVMDLQTADFKTTRSALFGDLDVGEFHWVDDESLVFGVIDLLAGKGKDETLGPGLFSARYDGSERRMLVDLLGRDADPDGTGRQRALTWNHDLLHVPTPSEAPDAEAQHQVIVGRLDWNADKVTSVTPLWLNIRTGRTWAVEAGRIPAGAVDWTFSAKGTPRAVITKDEGRHALHWFGAAKPGDRPQWRPLAEAALNELPFEPSWVGEGDLMYVTQPQGPAGESVLAPFDFKTGLPGAPLVKIAGFDFRGRLFGDAKGERLLGVRYTADAADTAWLEPALAALQKEIDTTFPGRVNHLVCRRCSADDAVLLVHSYSDRHPGELLLSRRDAEGRRWYRVTQIQPGIDPARMATVDLHRPRARDGRDLPVWITKPSAQQAGKGPLPAVVLVHGGPWTRGSYWHWDALPQYLASRGYLVIEPEFRGSTGYGTAHFRAGFKAWGQAMQDDVADALLWARQQGLASDKACIVGGSYGGYSALMGLVRHPELYRCASAWVAVTDPFMVLERTWAARDDISEDGRRYMLPEMVGDKVKDREMLLANSPLAQVASIKAPLQLVWGSQDRRVPIVHGERLRDALQKLGREPEWIVYDGEAHGWRKTEHQVDFARQLERFLGQHLR